MNKPVRNISKGRFRREIVNRVPPIISNIVNTGNNNNQNQNVKPVAPEKNDEKISNMAFSTITRIYFQHLIDTNVKGYDDQLPFFYNHPPIQGVFDLSTLANGKNQEVLRAYDDLKVESIKHEYEIVTILPFRGRWLHLEKTLESLISAASETENKIGFVIIENSQKPIFDTGKFSKYTNVHYRWLNSKGKIFNKCLCHNIGAGATVSNFIHFHDCDLPVPYNFYKALISELYKNPAVQAFSGRKVNYLKEIHTKEYFDGISINNITKDKDSYKEGVFGAPGGSIALSRELFNKAGGFDPHFFWAYSIEDRFFWEKVEKYNQITTLENPKIDLYHLWHPPGWGKNPYERFEQRIYQLFAQDRFGWQNYINTSRNLYKELIEKFIF
jgi:hypothetical protein